MKYGDWVMYYDNLHKVSRQIGDRLYLYPAYFSYSWSDPRFIAGRGDADEREIIVRLDQCTVITKEVADIMRSV